MHSVCIDADKPQFVLVSKLNEQDHAFANSFLSFERREEEIYRTTEVGSQAREVALHEFCTERKRVLQPMVTHLHETTQTRYRDYLEALPSDEFRKILIDMLVDHKFRNAFGKPP